MSDWQVDTLTLPGDMEWTDRTRWSPTKQSEELSLSGGVIIQKSTQTAGRPITIETNRRGVFVTYAQVKALESLRDNPLTGAFTLSDPDGTTQQVRFRHSAGEPVDAAPIHFRSPPADEDIYNLTLRLITV